MLLKNKKTGGIVNAMEIDLYTDVAYLKISKDGKYDSKKYNSLAELNEEWGDVPEEPNEYWFINPEGEVASMHEEYEDEEDTEATKEIGNYFSSREEAEKAVEKLKALKRLKDKGFGFVGWDKALRRQEPCDFVVFCNIDSSVESEEDLDLLFRR